MLQFLVVVSVLPLVLLALARPRQAVLLWVLALATAPDGWLSAATGSLEATAGLLKLYGLLVLAGALWRYGPRRDVGNPSLAFLLMFCVGLIHGLHPGLSLEASARSLIGSAAPFLFGFVRQDGGFSRTACRAVMIAPLCAVGVAAMLALAGLDRFYTLELGALRLGGDGQPPFLAGAALVGLYAGVLELAVRPRRAVALLTGINFTLILLTGARSPLVLGGLVLAALLAQRGCLRAFALAGALAALVALCFSQLDFLRVIDMTQLGLASNLSNRTLVWPYFWTAIQHSPWVGWGVGAGKIIIPLSAPLARLIGTNAAHDEYLRIGTEGGVLGLGLLLGLMLLWVGRGTARLPARQAWLMRLIFIAFAVQSLTDNTLIAGTASAFFLWVSAIFANAQNGSTGAACSHAAPPSPCPPPCPSPSPGLLRPWRQRPPSPSS
nr:O-antigen ligase family protein [uncultured Acidocella sp.]